MYSEKNGTILMEFHLLWKTILYQKCGTYTYDLIYYGKKAYDNIVNFSLIYFV